MVLRWSLRLKLRMDFTLHVQNKDGKSVDLPVKPDPSRGGFVLDGALPKLEDLGPEQAALLRGSWGFETFEGPTFHLRNAPAAAHWELSAEDESALVVGREDTFHLHSETCCLCRGHQRQESA